MFVYQVRLQLLQRSPARLAAGAHDHVFRPQTQIGRRADPFEKQLADKNVICGTPDQVIESLRAIIEQTRPSILALWGNDGAVSHADSMDCIRLMGQEVMPALRETGAELGLDSPFERDTQVSLARTPAEDLHPVEA